MKLKDILTVIHCAQNIRITLFDSECNCHELYNGSIKDVENSDLPIKYMNYEVRYMSAWGKQDMSITLEDMTN